MSRIIVTASTRMELSELLIATSAAALPGGGHLPVHRAEKGGAELLFAQTGIGKVNAAAAATLLCERYAPDLIINTGCGGAFAGSGLAVGDLAVADSECLADEGVQTPSGWRGLDLIGLPVYEGRGERLFNRIPLDQEVARRALDRAAAGGFKAVMGPFLTVSTCSGTARRGEELLRRFPGVCENMEGAAVAQVAFMYGVPCLEVRGISNMVEDRDLSRWDLKRAVGEVQRFLAVYLEQAAVLPGIH
ncbi:futalosine hydrolase [Geomonas sp. Red69]|uniref:futalosine hydrolase n=1 Tax=Geomonas diazotrophica TaxID=2843197 RepID=UPI001C111588|nr:MULTISPECIES: futalosine hydrolase [Geomonas]MBU5635709.1 futalosine hydrolase [Geomonas diazotrophica]QXE87183.1 futalosine hydrolase [Geomonas nitrogeniifigens]